MNPGYQMPRIKRRGFELFSNDQSSKRSDLRIRRLHAIRPRHRLFRRTGLMRRGPEPATSAARPRWCDQIPTLAENQLYPYSEHSCAHRHSHDFGKAVWRLRASNHRKPGVVMSIIPLDLERRCERRWAARFSRPTEPVAPRNQRPERESKQIAGPDKSKRKTHRGEAAGSRPLSAVCAGPEPAS
jgi:hypothetical protein